jgi:hypothetical protein
MTNYSMLYASEVDLIGKRVRAVDTVWNLDGSKISYGYIVTITGQYPPKIQIPILVDVEWGYEEGYLCKPLHGQLSDVPITAFDVKDEKLLWSWYPRFRKPEMPK